MRVFMERCERTDPGLLKTVIHLDLNPGQASGGSARHSGALWGFYFSLLLHVKCQSSQVTFSHVRLSSTVFFECICPQTYSIN